ncbi:hypothetical protein ACFPVX_03820 [Cohnella faecalis]|nr:hypothetical protein [Cohnella faecalis]
MSTAKKKPPITSRAPHKEEVNKKALIWIGAAFVVVVGALATLLALNI